MKKFLKLFLLVITCVFAVVTVDAEAVKETISVDSYTISKEPIAFPDSEHNGYANFHVKKDTSGKYIFCIHYAKKPPVSSVGYTKGAMVTDNGMNYILGKAYTASSDEEFFKYQTALWVYMVENNLMEGTHRDIDKFISSIGGATSGLAKEIRDIATAAKSASKVDTSNPTISVNTSNVTFTLNGNYYVSSKIKVSSSTGEYDVKLTSNSDIATVEKSNDGFQIKVKASAVNSLKTTISFTVNNYKEFYTSYYYTPSSASYQKVAATYKQQLSAEAKGSVELVKDTEVGIVKVDGETGEVLEGATLRIVDSTGKIVDEFPTTKDAYIIKGLSEGTYTLSEVEAPAGYVKSEEKVIFKIDANGNLLDGNGNKLDKVTFVNYKPEKGGATISKQDITNGKELPGAHLVIKNYETGEVIEEWISGTEPKYFELKPGTYTLTETIAPDGYILSNETITFTVKEDGSVTKVVMYNSPDGKEVEVEDTASFKTMTSSMIGAIVIAVGSFIIYKNSKKQDA
mgnify:CR=1 FL=1